MTAATLSSTFCGGGAVDSFRVSARTASDGFRRAQTVRIGCAGGAVERTGDQVRSALGLYSTWFDVVEDPRTGVGIRRGNEFHLRTTSTGGGADLAFAFGAVGADPLAGDWDGDGVHTVGVRDGQTWYLRNSNDAGTPDVTIGSFGRATDIPVVADWDGDGDDSVGVRRDTEIYFHDGGAAARFTIPELVPTDQVVLGDWNGDGRDEPGWLRGTTFYLTGGGGTRTVPAPMAGTPVIAVLDPAGGDTVGTMANGQWRILERAQTGSAVRTFQYGTVGDRPITGRWLG